MPEENVKVAVRVRPFNSREKGRNAELIIGMSGAATTIKEPGSKEEPRKFNFDFSYWSHDGCKDDGTGYFGPDTSHANGKKFADQKKVYNDLGVGVLNNAWEGYNSTLFAYGQTGSGKSWSMVGYGVNKGIVPLFCDNIFRQIEEKRGSGDKTEFEVSFSMLEIYNEQVRDLLDSSSKRGGLKVRQHPKKGFYAEGLRIVPVNSYVEIEKKMEEGTTNRTVASTNMNATSSRAHTIVGITFVQKFINAAGEETAKTAVINLVDLAGSERAESTGATGDRLKEGAAINQSLSCLGNCIAALADKSSGKNIKVPYRDSVLTKLLKNALGGNSKTIMIAALSPADINFEETLSTLRYADRAKQIKTSASVNEDPTEKLIRELQEENEKLKKMIESGKYEPIMGDDDDDDDDGQQSQGEKEQEYLSMLEKNRLEMEQMKKTFEERLQEAGETGGTDFNARSEKMKTTPHFYNLNPDPQLTGHIIFFLEGEEMTLGTDKESATISIRGPSIQPSHAFIRQAEGVFSVEPAVSHAKILHNGKTVGSKTDLKHHDRMMFGTTQLFVFAHPGQIDPKITYPDITYEFAQEEIRKKSGLDMDDESDGLLQDDLLESLPKIETANSYSEELNKKVKFTLIITSPEARGEHKGRNEVMVKVTNLETKYEWVWTKEKMFNRFFKMQEMFEDFQDGEEWDKKPEEDPFLDDMDADCYIGSVKLWLQSLSYVIESKEQLKMIDIQGKECGFLNYEIVPCNAKGKEYTENDDIFVDNPDELLGKDMHFKLKIISARGLPNKYSDAFAKYEFLLGGKTCQTKRIANTNNPDWNFSQQHDIPNVSLEALDYLKDGAVMIQIWGKQKKQKPKKTVNTKTAMLKETLSRGQLHAQSNEKKMDPDKVKYMMQAAMFKRRTEQLELKLHAMKKMLEVAEQNQKKKISVVLIKQIYHAPSADAAEKCIALIPKEKDDDDDDEDKTEDTKTKTNDETVKTDVVAGTHLVKDKKGTGNNSKHGKNDGDSSGSSSSDVSSSDEEDPPEKKQRKMEKRKRKAERQERKKRERELKEQGKVKSKLEVPKSNKKSSSCVLL